LSCILEAMASRHVERRRVGRGFVYFHDGQEVKDKRLLEYFESLKIPPAWKAVEIAKSPNAKILVTGYDKAGRLQYIYNPAFRAKKEKEKFERIIRFAKALPKMRKITEEHLKHTQMDREKVLACVVRLMDQAYFRVGNEVYAKENQSYGLTTIRSKHITFEGDTVIFDFIGKSGKEQVKEVTDRRIANIIRKLDDMPGYEVFKYYDDEGNLTFVKSDDVNAYIKEIMGEEFTAKDFRTWGGTLWATAELLTFEKTRKKKERLHNVVSCVERVAEKLGNTPAIARGSYIDPRILNAYEKGQDLSEIYNAMAKIKDNAYLNPEERCVLKLLQA
jgi:DNA topoisomerase I